jgi:membrane protein YqaA with SNARE-associated domain
MGPELAFWFLLVATIANVLGMMVGWQWGFACGKNEK